MRAAARMCLVAMMVVMATTPVSHAGVMVGSSSLIGSLDYSDTWTTTANGGNADRIDGATPSATALIVENSYGNASQSWTASKWEIKTDSSIGDSGYPGNSGAGSSTGLTRSTTDTNADFGIEYGISNEYVVQFDAVIPGDRIDITTAAVRDTIENSDGISVFFRSYNIGVYNIGVGETNTGIVLGGGMGISAGWHNFAVRFDIPDDEIEIYVDEISLATLDLGTFASGSYANIMDNSAVSIGGSGSIVFADNFQIGAVVPEPTTMVLLGIGSFMFFLRRRRSS